MSGALRGLREGQAQGARAIVVQRVNNPVARLALVRRFGYQYLVQGAFRTAGRMGVFVGCLLTPDVIALQYPSQLLLCFEPARPALGAAVAAALLSASRGSLPAAVAGTTLAAAMGLAFGVARSAFDLEKVFKP